METDSGELLRGTLDVLLLQTLSDGSKHGYEIAKWIGSRTRDEIQVGEGSLYPALRRLEKKGWLTSEWGHSDTNREVKYYRLTRSGGRHLIRQREAWYRYVEAMGYVLGPSEATL